MYGWPERETSISRHDLLLEVAEHNEWLNGSLTAKRLYLSYKDLSGLSSIGGLNLINTDFMESNCEGLIFRNCNLRHCNFIEANLANAAFIDCDLAYCNFLHADLSSITISNSNLYKVMGNGVEIKNFHIDTLLIAYTSHILQLDCIVNSLEWWRTATVEQLNELAEGVGQQLDVEWSGFMSPETIHTRISRMFQLIDSAPASDSFVI